MSLARKPLRCAHRRSPLSFARSGFARVAPSTIDTRDEIVERAAELTKRSLYAEAHQLAQLETLLRVTPKRGPICIERTINLRDGRPIHSEPCAPSPLFRWLATAGPGGVPTGAGFEPKRVRETWWGGPFDGDNSPQGTTANYDSVDLPVNASMVYLAALGAGAGGNGASSGVGGTAKSGGGGGGSASYATLMLAAFLLPSIFYVHTAIGGAGGLSGGAGSNGESTCFSDNVIGGSPTLNTAAILLSGSSNATANATLINGGTGAGAATANTYSTRGLFSSTGGQNGAGGGTGASGGNGTSVQWGPTLFFNGGPGGGGDDAAITIGSGGNVTGANLVPTIVGGSGAAAVTNNGTNGIVLLGFPYGSIFCFTSGGGGGAANSVPGGNGGFSGFGCGGAGAGAGNGGGLGALGGFGFAYMAWW